MGPEPDLLCDDRLGTDGSRASGRQHAVQDRDAGGSLALLGSESRGLADAVRSTLRNDPLLFSTKDRRPYWVMTCQASRPRSAIIGRWRSRCVGGPVPR
jgi:hypothetical protein